MIDSRSARVTAIASGVALIVVPLLVLLLQVMFGTAHVAEVLAGCVLGTAFFAVTGAVAAVYPVAQSLKLPLIYSYAFKILILLIAALFLPLDRMHRESFGISIVAAAVTYIAVQTALLVRSPRTPH